MLFKQKVYHFSRRKKALLMTLLIMALACAFVTPSLAVKAASVGADGQETYAQAFPDALFRQAVLAILNTDNGARTEESLFNDADKATLAACTELDVSSKGIRYLTGIEYFTGLKQLRCQDNWLETLNTTQNTELTLLYCQGNSLSELDVSKNIRLTELHCNNNYINTPASVKGWSELGLTINHPDNQNSGNFRFYMQRNSPLIWIMAHPASKDIHEGEPGGNLSVTAMIINGSGLTYQWYLSSEPSNKSGKPIEGATGASYALPDDLTGAGSPYYYYCLVSAPEAQSMASNVATIEVRIIVIDKPYILIISQPEPITVVQQGSINESLHVEAIVEFGGDPQFQWYSNTTKSNKGGTIIADATSEEFKIPADLTAQGGPYYYYCVISAMGAEDAISEVAEVTVYINSYNFRLYMESAQNSFNDGDTIYVDLMLKGDINYTQINATIAYDAGLLEYAGHANLGGVIGEIKKDGADKINIRSVPTLSMVTGAPCITPVKVATFKFTVKGAFTAESVNSDFTFAAIAVTPKAGVTGATTAPGNTLSVTVQK